MRFVVIGVDRVSGQDSTIDIDAASAAEAESIAGLSMLVADVKPSPTVQEPPQVAIAYAQRQRAGVDWVRGIARQALLLRILSWICAVFGAMGLLTVVLERVLALVDLPAMIAIVVIFRQFSPADLSGAILFLIGACLLRLASYFSLALSELLVAKLHRDQ